MFICQKIVRKFNANRRWFTKNKLVRKPSANSGELSIILQTVLKFLRHDNVTSCSKNILALHWFSNRFIFWKHFRFALIFRTNGFFERKEKYKNSFHWKSMKMRFLKTKKVSIENPTKRKTVFFLPSLRFWLLFRGSRSLRTESCSPAGRTHRGSVI